jgi:hypothetical protein
MNELHQRILRALPTEGPGMTTYDLTKALGYQPDRKLVERARFYWNQKRIERALPALRKQGRARTVEPPIPREEPGWLKVPGED